MQITRTSAALLGVFFAFHRSWLLGLLVAALVAGPPEGVRRWRTAQLVASLHARLVKLIKSGEYEADRAQDRRLLLRVLRTGNWLALFTSTAWEDSRTRVRPGRYITVRTLGGGVWPGRRHLTDVTIRWAPFVEINAEDTKRRILTQVAAWWGEEVEVAGGWDTPRCRVTVRPKAASDLPTSVPYPGSGPGEAEEPRGAVEYGKPRWTNWPDDERPL